MLAGTALQNEKAKEHVYSTAKRRFRVREAASPLVISIT